MYYLNNKEFAIILILLIIIILQQYQIQKLTKKGTDTTFSNLNSSPTIQKSSPILLKSKNFFINLFTFTGRISRWRYFMTTILASPLPVIYIYYLESSPVTIFLDCKTLFDYIQTFLTLLLILLLTIIIISAKCRRWHDLGKSSNYIFANIFLSHLFIPYGFLFSEFIMLIVAGDDKTNKYGDPPDW